MLEVSDKRILLLVLSLLTNSETTKLSEQKKCGDPECETAMSRVQAVRDHLGPDCRFLNFKTGEEIMVHFKLSRTREDLWAGSKGQEFGYFPADAIRVEEVLATEEVEVPTKETDFFCLEGEEHVFENEDRPLHPHGEDVPPDTDEGGSECASLTPRALPLGAEFPEPSPDRGEVSSPVERACQGDLECGSRQAAPGDPTQPGQAGGQSLEVAPTPPAWSVSRIAGWLGLGSQQREGPAVRASEAAGPQEEAETDGGEQKLPNDAGAAGEPGWPQGHPPCSLNLESETSGLGSLRRENGSEVPDSPASTGQAGPRSSAGAADTGEEGPRDPEAPSQNWFRLDLQEVLTFGYSSEPDARGGEAAQKDEPQPLNSQLTEPAAEEDSGTPGVASLLQEAPPAGSQDAPGPGAAPSDPAEQPAQPHAAPLDAAGTTLPPEPPGRQLQAQHPAQGSAADSPGTEGGVEESERRTGQSEGQIQSETQDGSLEDPDRGKEPPEAEREDQGLPGPPKEDFLVRDPEGHGQERAAAEDGGLGALLPTARRMDGLRDLLLAAAAAALRQAAAALPGSTSRAPDLCGLPWEAALLLAALLALLVRRSCRSVRSRLYVGREKQLASRVAELVEDKCRVLEKLSLCKQEFEGLENSLKDVSLLKGLTTTLDTKTVHEELVHANSALKSEIECLEKGLAEEKGRRSEQEDVLGEIQKKAESLENEVHSIKLQVAEAKTTLKVYEISRERLTKSVQDAAAENGHLQESQKQLLQEAEGWGERLGELSEQKKMFESSKGDLEEALRSKESRLKSLTECLLRMKDWSCAAGEQDAAEGSIYHNDGSAETENGEHVGDQEKRTVRKLIHAAKLSAGLKALEAERSQMRSKVTAESQAKEELAERIEGLREEHVRLQSENAQSEREVQKLQQKVKVMTELYQENEMNLHRKLTVEEKERLQKEERLSKADEKINHAAEERNAYRERAKDLEEELERTVRSYQSQIMSHEKKAHDNWLAARAAERFLSDLRKENSSSRQKLTEAEFKYDILEKDPHALDVPLRPFLREHSPYGPSAMGRPSSETRAFLSPPTLLEGPLRFSPVLLGGGGRGSRGPGSAGLFDASREGGELNSDRLPDPHRPPSDAGSLSPPWDRDRRTLPPPAGQPYDELPLRRPERLYSNPPHPVRLPGPADLRGCSRQSFEKADGRGSESDARLDQSGNGVKDHLEERNLLPGSDQPLPPEHESFGPGTAPPPLPLLRAPLMPVDPRGAFLRRGPPFPPVPPPALYGPPDYFPREFAGLPAVRGPVPMRPFLHHPPPRAGFFLPPPLDNRNELPSEFPQPPTGSSADNQEPHKDP